VNDAEVKRFNTSNYGDSFDSNMFSKNNIETSPKIGFINFVEINTSKSDDRSGFYIFLLIFKKIVSGIEGKHTICYGDSSV
jgi:hypothetical protein